MVVILTPIVLMVVGIPGVCLFQGIYIPTHISQKDFCCKKNPFKLSFETNLRYNEYFEHTNLCKLHGFACLVVGKKTHSKNGVLMVICHGREELTNHLQQIQITI